MCTNCLFLDTDKEEEKDKGGKNEEGEKSVTEGDAQSARSPSTETASLSGEKNSLADRVSQFGVKLGGWWGTGPVAAARERQNDKKTGIEVANEAVDEVEHSKAAVELKSYSTLSTDSYGFPLSIFTKVTHL